MGVSTDAILAFGFDLGEEEELEFELPRDLHGDVKWDAIDGVRLILHCSYDYPMWFLALDESVQKASRGYPTAVDVRFEMDYSLLESFCEKYGIPYQDPDWYIFSVWG